MIETTPKVGGVAARQGTDPRFGRGMFPSAGRGRRALLAGLVCLASLGAPGAPGEPATSPAIRHTGSAACAACHPAQSAAWRRSDHYRSMQSATAGAVAGDFSGARVRFHGIDTRFLRDDAGYRIETIGADGHRRSFPVRYTHVRAV